MKSAHIFRGLCLGTFLLAAACSSPSDVSGLDAPGVDTQVTAVDVDIEVLDMDANGIPNFLGGVIGGARVELGASASDIERVMFPALEKASPLMRMKAEELSLTGAIADKEGDQHFRFQQFKNGLMVLGGEVVAHVRDGVVFAVNGSARGDYEAQTEPKIDERAAFEAATRGGRHIEGLEISEEYDLAYKLANERLEMVYVIDVRGTEKDGTPVHDTLHVSTVDGAILGRESHIFTAKNREMHDLGHGTGLPGATVRTEGGAALPSNANNDPINKNYDHLGMVWDAYKNLFNRDSYNDAGAKLVSSCHYSNNYVNAFWNGTQMVYGDGDGVKASNLANSLDVTGHELTHAVTSSTSKLVYSDESGGLNEAWSDVLGNVVQWYAAGRPATLSNDFFLVGEDVWTPGTSGDALRYMCDPAADGGSADLWYSGVGSLDVHYSSGVANLAFCLLVKGGQHPRGKTSTTVTGIGMAKAAQIWYKAELIMTSTTDFAGAKTATEQAAAQLGYSSADIASVSAAWQAVGVSGGGGGTCAHDKCASGGALTSSCNSVVSAVCASDPYCCNTAWDSICVSEGRTIGKSLKCSEATGTCAHNMCSTGAALANSCDSAKSNCVATICASDPYCCSTSWDSVCVGEVASMCGKNCN